MIALEKDSDGWSVLPTSPDAEIYVDFENGNDTTGNGSVSTPYKTIEKACDVVVDGECSIVYLQNDQTFTTCDFQNLRGKSGESATRPIVFTSYEWGNAVPGNRPKLESQAQKIRVVTTGDELQYVAFIGLELTQGTSYDANTLPGKTSVTLQGAVCDSIYFEDCYIHETQGVVLGSSEQNPQITDFKLYRCVFYQCFSSGNNCGLIVSYADNTIIDECAYIRNGWHPDHKDTNVLTRNFYTHRNAGRIRVTNTLSCDTSSEDQLRSGGFVENCVFEHGRYFLNIGFGFSVNPQGDDPVRFNGFNSTVRKSAFIDSTTFEDGSNRGSQIQFSLLPSTRNGIFEDNIMANDTDSGASNNRCLRLHSVDDPIDVTATEILSHGVNNMTIKNNIFYNVGSRAFFFDYSGGTGTVKNVVVSKNYIDCHGASNPMVKQVGTDTNTVYSDNTYYHRTRLQTDGTLFEYNSSNYTFAQWVTNVESDATWEQQSYADPTRNFPRYYREKMGYATTGTDDGDREALYQLILLQRKGNWDVRLTATAINNWIRQGFGRSIGTSI